ncbi:MAG: isochorismatase family protein [Methylophagaceae bacterium]
MNASRSLLLNPSDSMVVVVDIQQRLTAVMPHNVGEQVITRVKQLIIAANTLAVPIVVTEQYPKGLGPTEAELVSELDDATMIEKTNFSCVKAEGFSEKIELLKRKQIILVGMECHICILQTAIDLMARDFQVYIVSDGVSSRTKDNYNNGLQRMRDAGVIITNLESVIFEWLGDAKHPQFKTLAKLIV